MSTSFYITNPLGGKTILMLSNKEDDRVELINDRVLERYEDYMNEHWLYGSGRSSGFKTYEDNVKKCLERCADFILEGEIKGLGIMGYKKKKSIKAFEIPMLTLNIGMDSSNNDLYQNMDAGTMRYCRYTSQLNDELVDPSGQKRVTSTYRPAKRTRRINPSKRIRRLFSFTQVVPRFEKYKLTNKELYDRNGLEYPTFETQEELKSWLKTSAKNILNEFIWDVRVTIPKQRNGLLQPNDPYNLEWAMVNTLNEFEYKGKTYVIDAEVEAYKVEEDNQCAMERILIAEQYGNVHYYDEQVNEIKGKYIQEEC